MNNLIEVITFHDCPATIRLDAIVCIEKIKVPEKFNGAETIITVEKGKIIYAKMSYDELRQIIVDYEDRFNDIPFEDDEDFRRGTYSDN